MNILSIITNFFRYITWLICAVVYDMVKLRSGSTTDSLFANMCEQLTSEQFGLFLIEACKSPDIQTMMKNIVTPNGDYFKDLVSAEVHRQIQPLKHQLQQKDQEILDLKKTIVDQQVKLDDLEQHGRRDSLRISGIPEPAEHDNTDAAVLSVCESIQVDPPLQPRDIAVSHRVGRKTAGKHRQIIIKFATRNVRERVFGARTGLKDVNKDKDANKRIYINEDLTQFRAALASEARSYKKSGLISDTWTMYGKLLMKDNYGHVSVISWREDLTKHRVQAPTVGMSETGGRANEASSEAESRR